MDDREIARELLRAVTHATKAAEKMMESEDENVQVFAVDAVIKLTEMAIALLTALEGEELAEEENPLARRARLDR